MTGYFNEGVDFVLGRGVVADGAGLFLEDGALLVSKGKIKEIGPWESVRRDDLPFYDVEGRLILPGFVNFHHHLYSFFAPGISPAGPTETFPDILENLWWRLDRVIDEEVLYYSVLMGALDSLSFGVTSIFDHHASMNFDRGSLDVAAEAFAQAGPRAVLCLETSDRQGKQAMMRQVEENISFWEKHRSDPFLGGMFGLHANLTLSEETLSYISGEKPQEMPVHVHCGEAREDLAFCRKLGYEGPVDRLHSFGLLDDDSFLIHCVHLSEKDYFLLGEVAPVIVLNPESNATNRVGKPDKDRLPGHLLGTDGMSGDIVAALRNYFLLGDGGGEPYSRMRDMMFSLPAKVLSRHLPVQTGFQPGAAADIAVLDYIPLSPVSEANLLGHLLFGAKGGKAHLTAVNGRVLWRKGEFLHHDMNSLRFRAKRAASALSLRFRNS